MSAPPSARAFQSWRGPAMSLGITKTWAASGGWLSGLVSTRTGAISPQARFFMASPPSAAKSSGPSRSARCSSLQARPFLSRPR
jgi:hypothetical protein